LVVISLNFFSVEKIFKIKKPAQFTLFILCSLIPAILWFWLMPYTRYGGYAYLSFSLIILYYSLTFKPYHLFKIANFILIFGIIYFLSKNILRINNELESNNNLDTAKLLLIKNLGNYQFKTKQINNEKKIYISSHNWWCGNVPLPCLPGFWENMNIKINEKYGYQIISVNQKEYLDFQIKKMNIYNLSKDRYNLDYNEEIRLKK
jgi:hypothetical protein